MKKYQILFLIILSLSILGITFYIKSFADRKNNSKTMSSLYLKNSNALSHIIFSFYDYDELTENDNLFKVEIVLKSKKITLDSKKNSIWEIPEIFSIKRTIYEKGIILTNLDFQIAQEHFGKINAEGILKIIIAENSTKNNFSNDKEDVNISGTTRTLLYKIITVYKDKKIIGYEISPYNMSAKTAKFINNRGYFLGEFKNLEDVKKNDWGDEDDSEVYFKISKF